MRLLAALALALASLGAGAQTSPTAQQVALLAPQLRAFAGSPENFEALAVGLTLGTPFTLTTTRADGSREIVIFTPAQPMSAAEVARALEAARQGLIGRGIAAPAASQLAAELAALSDPQKPMSVVVRPFAGSRANLERLTAGLKQGSSVTLESAKAGEPVVSFVPPGGPMTAEEAAQTLQLASQLLAAQGIHDPSPEQLRAALVGGTVRTPSGATVALRGVLEGRQRFTSESRQAGQTSDTPRSTHTSDSPARAPGGEAAKPPAAAPAGKPLPLKRR
jgi:hypothetical protein